MDVSNNTSPDEAVSQRHQMRILLRVIDGYIREFDVEVLIDRLKLARDGHVVLELNLDGSLLIDELLENLKEEHSRLETMLGEKDSPFIYRLVTRL